MQGFIKEMAAKRTGGGRPSPVRAFAVATVTGLSAGVIAYKLMRSAE